MKPIAPFLLLLLAGCGGGAADSGTAPEKTAEVRTASAELGASNNDLTVYGATEAGPGATHALVMPAEALVAAINAPTGTAVGAGQVVLTLRPSAATRTEISKAANDAAAAMSDEDLQKVVESPFGSFPAWQYFQFAYDEHWHHRGQLYTYLRLLGKEPPMLYSYEH